MCSSWLPSAPGPPHGAEGARGEQRAPPAGLRGTGVSGGPPPAGLRGTGVSGGPRGKWHSLMLSCPSFGKCGEKKNPMK